MIKICLREVSFIIGLICLTVSCSPMPLKQVQEIASEKEIGDGILIAPTPTSTPIPISTSTNSSSVTVLVAPTSVFDGTLPDNFSLISTDMRDWTFYDPIKNPDLKQYDFNSVVIAPDGNIWMGGQNGIAKFDGDRWTSFFIPEELLPNESVFHITDIDVDKSGSVWTGGRGTPVFRFNKNVWEKVFDEKSVTSIEINPYDQSLWLTFDGRAGAMKFDGERWTSYTGKDGLISNQVFDVAMENNGTIWFATDTGISSFDGNKWTNFPLNLFCSLPSCNPINGVRSIAIGPDGTVWFTLHYVGLFHFISGKWEMYENSLVFGDYFPVEKMCFTPNGRLWIGKWSETGVALSYFEGERWYFPGTQEKDGTFAIPVGLISDIACANDNSIWFVSASRGVVHFIP